MFNWFRKRRRKRILAIPWPDPWDAWLSRHVKLSRRLPPAQQQRLRDLIRIFVAEKDWEGLDGLAVTEEMQVTIAGQACLMLLGVEDFVFENVQTILIFPDAFHREVHDGLVVGSERLSGEAWQGGPIVLAWDEVLEDCRGGTNGFNVVIHEFAHALDGLDGEMGGNITFADTATHEAWQQVVSREYNALVAASRTGRPTLLNPYGATNRAEFFAVATEAFFELPDQLARMYPELYQLMAQYFQLDPRDWQPR